MAGATTRGENAGKLQAKAIIEYIHLMYQNNTALSYLNGLINLLIEEKNRREKIKEIKI